VADWVTAIARGSDAVFGSFMQAVQYERRGRKRRRTLID
jgi:hypothetical protein